ncbi:YscQ/HrcQ family type III secretion apparatus protein [Chromobacterium alkanivorans]|uniref:YscQ/HrcQ family type III secretion apparatus protein n=1 Tax=Chromobacterium TaxID=535 RepID=UPI00069D5F82|nr:MULTISPECIES: YscQ/HrcQ family type III secretion apparatus protein [Chromobacterium]MBN3002374.1 YscQ/HrcQ family type III secretion apparatus protein [Chromobacterium alkanivorans]
MLALRQIDARERALRRAAEAWRRQGWDATLETPPRGGLWLSVADAEQRWQGWLQPRAWLESAAPELARLALSAGVESQAAQWLAAAERPLTPPMPELAYQRLSLGEAGPGDALPRQPLLRVMCAEGPLWLERAPEFEAGDAPDPAPLLSWPLRFVVGDSRVSLGLLRGVARGDVLLIREPKAAVRCHDRALGTYQTYEEGIVMEWDESQQEAEQEAPARDMGQLPVELEFVLHRGRMTLAELQDLCRGRLLNLPADVERRVEVRANGALLGRGELVQLAGHLGVEVTEWLGGAADVE